MEFDGYQAVLLQNVNTCIIPSDTWILRIHITKFLCLVNKLTRDKLFVLNLAPTGMVAQVKDCPALPVSPMDIANDIIACGIKNVTSVHLHARHSDGSPDDTPDTYASIIENIRLRIPDIVICVSCSGRVSPSYESRSRVLDLDGKYKPDMASLTPSSMNFLRSPSVNAPDTVWMLAKKMRDTGIKPEIEIFDLGMVNYTKYLIKKGVLEPPYYFNIILGNVASAQMDPLHLGAILRELPNDSIWSLGGIGDAQLTANAVSLALGGGVRVGLEDNIWMNSDRSKVASNPGLVKRVVEIGEILGREPMAPATFRERLGISSREMPCG